MHVYLMFMHLSGRLIGKSRTGREIVIAIGGRREKKSARADQSCDQEEEDNDGEMTLIWIDLMIDSQPQEGEKKKRMHLLFILQMCT